MPAVPTAQGTFRPISRLNSCARVTAGWRRLSQARKVIRWLALSIVEWVCTHIYTGAHMYMYKHVHVHTHTITCTHVNVHVHTHTITCTHVNVHIVHTPLHVHM